MKEEEVLARKEQTGNKEFYLIHVGPSFHAYGGGAFALARVTGYRVMRKRRKAGNVLTASSPVGQLEQVRVCITVGGGIIGLRTNVLTASQGEAIMAHRFKEYQPYKGDIERRVNGSMIALETGNAFAYAIDKLQDRGKFFIDPGEDVYMGQVVGEHVHDNDLVVNVCKAKQLTNVRASGTDEKARIIPKTVMSLEECLEYIKEDELVEVTPKSMRMRKIILDHDQRKKAAVKRAYFPTPTSLPLSLYTQLGVSWEPTGSWSCRNFLFVFNNL